MPEELIKNALEAAKKVFSDSRYHFISKKMISGNATENEIREAVALGNAPSGLPISEENWEKWGRGEVAQYAAIAYGWSEGVLHSAGQPQQDVAEWWGEKALARSRKF